MCVSAKGPVFSSGHDLKELTSAQGRDYHFKVFQACSEVWFTIVLYTNILYTQTHIIIIIIGNESNMIVLCRVWLYIQYTDSFILLLLKVMTLIQDIPVPVIAMVNGVATAAGCQLVASCDIAVVTEKSTFATPGVNVGLFCSTPAVAIGRAVPKKVNTHAHKHTLCNTDIF